VAPVRPSEPLGAVGLILPTFVQDTVPTWAQDPSGAGPDDDPLAELAELCRRAEVAGADALWACDHLFWHGPCLECMVVLTVAATATERAALGSCVIQLPLRRAVAVAKQAATLQTLSRGRLILGVGVGSHPGEYEQVGAAYHRRGHDLDTAIGELHRAWGSGHGAYRGDTSSSDATERYRQLPSPSPVPVWVGGSSEAALRRAAHLADGWMPLFLSVDEYGDAVERLAKEADAVGRQGDPVTPAMVLFVSLDEDRARGAATGTAWMGSLYGLPPKAFDRHLVAGTPDEVATRIAEYRSVGAEHVAVYVTDDEPIDQFERLMTALPAAGVPARTPSTAHRA
jgi:alkanesulfonate monooxygenase SsuD/methylene tetrahydromethanopterin reductase-like flavin-dependent oxidoreductase (luciferase family)